MNSPKKARRRTVGKVNSQEDLISQFESGEGVSKKSQQMGRKLFDLINY